MMHDLVYLLVTCGLSLIFLALVFYPLEKAYPAKEQHIFRKHLKTDLLYFFGQYLLWGGLILFILTYCSPILSQIIPEALQLLIQAQSFWIQAIIVLFLSDLCIYWVHRLQHSVSFLWRFHSVHHSAEQLDWVAAHREHPIDGLITQFAINLPFFLLGFSIETLSGLVAFRGIWAVYIHSNVRLPLGPLKYLVGAPEIHHWHHEKTENSCNFANLSPIMDIIFRTFHCPDTAPKELGINESIPSDYFNQLIHPFKKRFN